ncbi:hypothetical protein [Listeria booriae]|uniref:hypothetical protein n=1 Tax=Listeria booriae TaxID=1552123 RepID=UPI001625901C|nr:hypothetical protein [Listeria booriae]MBC2196286.1 hypothetical protein [Listeria booriae]
MRANEKFHYLVKQNLLVISNYKSIFPPPHERNYISALQDGFNVSRVIRVRGDFELHEGGYSNDKRNQSIKRRRSRKRN